jgi:16S rRNA processing protein RimM
MITGSNVTYIGYIAKPHGYKGQIKIKPLRESFDECNPEWLFFCIDSKPVPYAIESIAMRPDEWVVKVEFLDDDESVRRFQNIKVGILSDSGTPSSPIPVEMIGFQVYDQSNKLIGAITSWIERPQQPLLEIETEKGNVLIPLVEEWILNWEEADRSIQIQIPDGLIDL